MPPLELFSLEEEAAQLPGGLFVCRVVFDSNLTLRSLLPESRVGSKVKMRVKELSRGLHVSHVESFATPLSQNGDKLWIGGVHVLRRMRCDSATGSGILQ